MIPLNVSGAFHSPLMADAAKGHARRPGEGRFSKRPSVPVAMNADGQLHQSPEDIRRQLELQLDHPVQWVQVDSESLERRKASVILWNVGPDGC